jgi:hypothetical protein
VWTHERGLDLRHPLRDLRLIEAILGLPADVVDTPARPKQLLRQAAAPLLPREPREARRRGTLYALYRRGAERESASIASLLARPCDELGALISPSWLAAARAGRLPNERQEVALWHCACFQRWRTQV